MLLRAALALVAFGTFAARGDAQSPTLVFIVRHAEKAAEPASMAMPAASATRRVAIRITKFLRMVEVV